jgi:hypothetical protein
MSGYLVSLVERARGEGAALQPRVRARFEPHGFEEVSAESESPAPRSSSAPPALDEPHAPRTAHVRETPLSIDDDREIVREIHATTTRTEAAATELPSPAAIAAATSNAPEVTSSAPRVTHLESTALPTTSVTNIEPDPVEIEQVRIEHSIVTRDIERERVLPHPPLRVATTRSIERATHRDTTRVVRLPHEEDAEPQPIHITIGRIDVRAIAPPAQSRPSPAAAKRNASLTLDDYLRRRDGGKR